MLQKSLIILGLLFTLVFFVPSIINAEFSITGSNSLNGTVGVAQTITDLQLSGTGTEPIPVKLLVTSGTLTIGNTTGLTFDGVRTGSTLYFSGTFTNVNNALATLAYTRGSTGTDTLEVSLVSRGEVFFTENGHLYKFISGSISANSARTAALAQTAYGSTGYLATITSAEENTFVATRLQGDGWMGASDAVSEGDWKWLDGPEAGISFWSGAAGGSPVGGRYENWSSGEPNDYLNGSPGEDCAQFYISTSMWNDLPCSGSNLSGYVVEFGATGDLPEVVAKNVSITTTSNPTVNSLSPADDATGVGLTANLIIGFSQTISAGTGNVLIKKLSDDSTVETISISGGQVTGIGSTVVTINPSTTFIENTAYYISIPSTGFKNNSSNFYAGIGTTSGWNFTTGDFTNPTLSNIASGTVTSSAATITWNTNESTSTKVNYGLTNAYGSSTSETDTSPRVTSHAISLSSLLACTTYHYNVVSRDASSNSATSSDNTFTTAGCTADTTPTNTTSNAITPSSGGTTSLTENNTQLTVQAPSNFTDDSTSVVIQIKAIDATNILASLGRPTTVPREVGDIVFDVKAIIDGTTILDSFDAPITITYQYADADISGLNESSLWLYHYHNGAWDALESCTITASTNTISCTTDSFSIFGLFGNVQSSSGSSNSNSVSNASCKHIKPAGSPEVFQIDVTNNKATLYFTPINKNVSNYFIAYGYNSGEERFGTLTDQGESSGVLSYTINHLDKNTTYYFKIRSQNGCTIGDWGNVMKVTTTQNSETTVRYYKNFISRILSGFAKQPINLGSNTSVKGKTTAKVEKKSKSCQYNVKAGDTLWNIAESKLGMGSNYTIIMKENSLNSTLLRTGQVLNIKC